MKKYKRIFTIVIDSLGIGAMANAAEYGDAGTDTLGHIDERMKEFRIPNLAKLGLADLHRDPCRKTCMLRWGIMPVYRKPVWERIP